MKIRPDTLKKVIMSLAMTQDDEMDCGDCYEHLDKFVELIESGKDPKEVMPLMQNHIEVCHCCREETEALLEALKAIGGSEE